MTPQKTLTAAPAATPVTLQHARSAVGDSHPGECLDVSAGRHASLSEQELTDHIEHCAHLMELAEDRSNPQERDGWWQAMHQAIKARDELYGRLRHAAFEAALDNGVDYFAAAGARDRAMLGRQAA